MQFPLWKINYLNCFYAWIICLQHNLSGLPGLDLIKATSIVHLRNSMVETDCGMKHSIAVKKTQAHPVFTQWKHTETAAKCEFSCSTAPDTVVPVVHVIMCVCLMSPLVCLLWSSVVTWKCTGQWHKTTGFIAFALVTVSSVWMATGHFVVRIWVVGKVMSWTLCPILSQCTDIVLVTNMSEEILVNWKIMYLLTCQN